MSLQQKHKLVLTVKSTVCCKINSSSGRNITATIFVYLSRTTHLIDKTKLDKTTQLKDKTNIGSKHHCYSDKLTHLKDKINPDVSLINNIDFDNTKLNIGDYNHEIKLRTT